ncbi:hypothetical protein [Flavobacterium luteum]|uniref:Uncharacterized protein n=1 Tax=Flavobacterium luteum TaxID=2026654 RepID=A0A7J5AB51_9FLAO|nr:hypothetical protein [Flavobacterium luteum]KAB1154389.1 hypothetical protein F6464_12600 [Flavobacterium luteum]
MIEKELSEYLTNIEKIEGDIISYEEKIFKSESEKCLFDTFCIAQLNRSLNLVDAFVTLAKIDNYIVAMALVRLHLDTLLRLYAIRLTRLDVNQVVEEILNGKSINKLKDGTNKKPLTDSYLKEKISEMENFIWVKETYEKSSGFVHFSDNILRASNLGDTSNMSLKHSIKLGSSLINGFDKKVACVQMIKITEGIFGLINNWIDLKEK